MEKELDEKIRKEVRRNYAAIILKLLGLLFLGIILTAVIVFSIMTFGIQLDYQLTTLIVVIPILIVFLYLAWKESNKPYVPIDIFLLPTEEIIFSEYCGRLEGNKIGAGFCYLTTKRFIYLPTNYARSKKGANALILPLRNIKAISKSEFSGFKAILTRNKKYLLGFHDIDEWKVHLKRFLYIRTSNL